MKENGEKKGLGIYVHIPFCVKKCAYCDFLSFPVKDAETYLSALKREIFAAADRYGDMYRVDTVFFGGGTPTVLSGETLAGLLGCIRESFQVCDGAEITTEANPGTTDKRKLAALRRGGFNRISFGCQSAKDGELEALGRIHTFEQFVREFRDARAAGFDNINVDLMSAIPRQTGESWRESLETVAALGPEHISAYSLIIEEGTPFYELERQGMLPLPDEDTERQMYEDTAAVLGRHGYAQYEISNYALPGYACRHNLAYWQGKEYLGLGLGAASYMEVWPDAGASCMEAWPDARASCKEVWPDAGASCAEGTPDAGQSPVGRKPYIRFVNPSSVAEYTECAGDLTRLHQVQEVLDTAGLESEFMILGLRMTEGVSKEEFYSRFGVPMEQVYGPVLEKYTRLGLIETADGQVRLTRAGISVSNVVLAELLQ